MSDTIETSVTTADSALEPSETNTRDLRRLPPDRPPSPAAPRAASRPARRSVDEYRADALSQDRPLDRLLGEVTAGVATLSLNLGEIVNEQLTARPVTLEQIRQCQPAIQLYLQAVRQFDRNVQFAQRVADARQRAATEGDAADTGFGSAPEGGGDSLAHVPEALRVVAGPS